MIKMRRTKQNNKKLIATLWSVNFSDLNAVNTKKTRVPAGHASRVYSRENKKKSDHKVMSSLNSNQYCFTTTYHFKIELTVFLITCKLANVRKRASNKKMH